MASSCATGSSSVVRGEVGSEAWLPCDIDSNRDDSPAKVLWFRPQETPFFYKVEDTSGRGLWNAEHAIGVVWAGRASFSVARSPAALRLSQLRDSDAGAYLCTVAFHSGAQRNATVHLVVGVSPSVPVIETSTGKALENKIGPFLLGDSLKLICFVEKGSPTPSIRWRRNGVPVPDDSCSEEHHPRRGTRSALLLESLSREDLLTELTCEASNVISGPLTTSVLIDLTLPPLSVRILDRGRAFESDVSEEFRCHVLGSRPPAQVSWWLEDRRLEPFLTEEQSNATLSTLLLVLSAQLDGSRLTCRALNPRLPEGLWEDSITLSVYHAPRAALRFGQGLDPDRIVEGQDVYLECAIRANPRVTEVSWTLDGTPMDAAAPNATVQVLVQEQYLVVRNVSRSHSGSYRCRVRSPRGAAVSNSLRLRVQYAPRCRNQSQAVLYYSTAREEMRIICDMEADPPSLSFRWIVRNNSETHDLLSFNVNGTRSEAHYQPSSASEFSSLLCWANNSVGVHRRPCSYAIEPHGGPKSLSGCLVVNQATTWFLVECTLEVDRPDEWYSLEVFHADSGHLLANVTSLRRPTFRVGPIPPATECLALAFAVNDRGRSQPQKVVVRAIPPPSKLLTSSAGPSGGLALTACLVAALIAPRRIQGSHNLGIG
ncbi:B-cell receptor CD22-like isoform X2 [Ornithodoros turicata]|uniref:B-cell receptor CD22-like isoform X2 n=1 Tax=Ornithodoros turicata TaxID=34597 RepID=UPI0031398FF6